MKASKSAFASEKVITEITASIKHPWSNRMRMDREVLGAIELAAMRGYQAGFEDARKFVRRRRKAKCPE